MSTKNIWKVRGVSGENIMNDKKSRSKRKRRNLILITRQTSCGYGFK